MPSTGSGPGKTAPKLLNDFLHFDPLRSPPNSNYLTNLTPPVGEGPQLGPSQGSCKHEYTPKWNQSVAPPLDARPEGGAQYKIAVICKKCRIHADVHIFYPFAVNPCPNHDYPLHHFQRHPAGDEAGQERIVFGWLCSAPECGAQLRVSFRRPRVQIADKDLLTDTEKLRRRYEAVVADDPEREGLRQATPIDALSRLRRYIKDALNSEHARRTFPANNKRFMEAYGVEGQDCADLLTRLGFRYGDEQWTLPQPPALDDRLRASGDSLREMLEDVEMELLAWTIRLATETSAVNPFAGESWTSADRDIERLLAAQGYTRHMSLRRTAVSNEELPYFASLGAISDFADSLIVFAFNRQSLCDPERRPYYFECLQVISESRTSDDLQMKVATLSSQDLVSRRDLNAAYRTFSIAPADVPRTDDERVLNLYHVLISDVGPDSQNEARQALYKIGVSRGSQQLIKAAQQTMDTYEDALSWLGNGVDKTTSDDMLLSVVAIKIGESKGNEELVQKAISIIAKERKSNALNSWLLTGNSDNFEMSPEEALRHLGVDGNVKDIDASVLPAAFEFARNDRPGEQTEKAIAALQKAISGAVSSSHPLETWPVGLESHGNTCYLNSLLQYYFSVAPLRDIILNYDDYKLDTTKHTEKLERVGRSVTMMEIKGGQRFSQDLKHLFERMIKEPRDRVKPDSDLVCRAFLDLGDYEMLDNAVQGTQVNGVESAVDDKVIDEAKEPAKPDDRHQSDASSVTLQAESTNGDGLDVPMKDAEMPLTPPDSGGEDKGEQPATAPPLPPRRFSTSKVQALEIAQAKAKQQQDTSEVHLKLMFRLQVGMTPRGRDSQGEQEDAIRDLFEIGITVTPVVDGVEKASTPYPWSEIQLPVSDEDTDIYSQLDAVFDLQEASGAEAYLSLRSLPPLLQINMPRIGFQNDGRGAYKSNACIKLEDELYLDRYCEQSGNNVLQKRRLCWEWRRQLHALKKEQKALSTSVDDLDGPTAVTEAANYLNTLPDVNANLESIGIDLLEHDPDLSAALMADAGLQKDRLTALKDEIQKLEAQLKGQFDEDKRIKYRLAAVMIHRGNSIHGHYWTYIHDFGNDMWRMYNDERVEEFTKVNDMLEARTWEAGTPTFAIYVQDDKKEKIIQPVCRAPEKLPTPEPSGWEDVTMQNGQSQPSAIGIDPKLTVNEGNTSSWDEERKMPDVKCDPYMGNDGLVKFVLRREPKCEGPVGADRQGSMSPKRRHDSTSESYTEQESKHRRLSPQGEDEAEGDPKDDAAEGVVDGIDDLQIQKAFDGM